MSNTMTMAQSSELFAQLPEHQRQSFYSVASKSESGQSAQEFFHAEIPDVLKDNPEGIDILMNGGTVTVPVDTFERGRMASGTETVEFQLPDRDFSRIQSGQNNGDYTTDNVVLEDASINRSRQGTDMTEAEFETATESLAADAELIDASIVSSETAIIADVGAAAESADSIVGTVLEGVLPVTVGAKLAHAAWTENKDMDDSSRIAATALVGGAGVAGTVLILANPVGAACAAAWGTYKLAQLGCKLASKYS